MAGTEKIRKSLSDFALNDARPQSVARPAPKSAGSYPVALGRAHYGRSNAADGQGVSHGANIP